MYVYECLKQPMQFIMLWCEVCSFVRSLRLSAAQLNRAICVCSPWLYLVFVHS